MKRLAIVPHRERAKGALAPRAGSAADVLEAAAACTRRGARAVMATVVARHGSAPGTPGQKLLLADDGTCIGSVGGGAVEHSVLEALRELLRADGEPRHQIRTFALGPELGMCCGGRLEVMLEPLAALVPCLVVGGGHVATALAPILSRIGFAVTIVDDREEWAPPETEGRVLGEFDEAGKDVDPRGVCLVMTHDHALDQKAIEWALRRGFAFVGGVGSRAKAERTRRRLEAKGFSEADRARVRMPLGVDVGARLPDEIAVSIAAELVAWRRKPR